MSNIGFTEIAVILVIALLIFGPRKLPELGKSLGAGLREFKRGTQGLKEEFEAGLKEEPAASPAANAAPRLSADQVVARPVEAGQVTAGQQVLLDKKS